LFKFFSVVFCICSCLCIVACGGGKSSKKSSIASTFNHSSVQVSSSVGNTLSSSSSTSLAMTSQSNSSSPPIVISGKVTFDFVPHNTNHMGLNYSGVVEKPGRGLLVELLDQANNKITDTVTDNTGNYSLQASLDQLVKVRVKAQLRNVNTPTWDFKVTDNTSDNSLYVMDGSLVAATTATSIRNLKANSGWGGSSYTQTRVAAPFAILDSVYTGIQTVAAASSVTQFPPLELRWSIKNKPANGDIDLGEIGTSYYDGEAIYILGDANNDIDEYDSHVILHEWGHYIENQFSRSDSIGGAHTYGDKLDMRVAMSEGFSNAFSAMMLKDSFYKDANGNQQSSGLFFDIARKNYANRGYFVESSVDSVLYNFYVSNSGKIAENFADIFSVMNAVGYKNSEAMISIYVFAKELRTQQPSLATLLNGLLGEQNIAVANEFGDGESNSGGYSETLPIYKPITLMGGSVNVCSSNRFGSDNKLGVGHFLLIAINAAGNYQFNVIENGIDSGSSDPDIRIFDKGRVIGSATGTSIDQEQLSMNLSPGNYVLEVADVRAQTQEPNTSPITACFNVTAQRLN
jgi:hypothetical protein